VRQADQRPHRFFWTFALQELMRWKSKPAPSIALLMNTMTDKRGAKWLAMVALKPF
jgi:hypothetical protein